MPPHFAAWIFLEVWPSRPPVAVPGIGKEHWTRGQGGRGHPGRVCDVRELQHHTQGSHRHSSTHFETTLPTRLSHCPYTRDLWQDWQLWLSLSHLLGHSSIALEWFLSSLQMGFPDSSVDKESNCNAGDPGLIPGLGRSAEGVGYPFQYSWVSPVAQLVKNLPAMWETWVRSLGSEDPLEKEKATHSSILA